MPPKIEWPPEAELRKVFKTYQNEGCIEREDQIVRFQRQYTWLKASDRSVLDLIRSLENNTGRVLDTIRSRDARERNRDGSVTPPPRTHIELRSPHRRAASPGAATNASEAQSRKHPLKPHEISRSLHSDRKGKGRAVAPSGTSEEENSISAYSSEQVPSTSHRQVMREEYDRERRLSQRLREKIASMEEDEQALQARYDADHKSWSTKALELESENTLLTERVQDADKKFESMNSRHEAELRRLEGDLSYWKERAVLLENRAEILRNESTEVRIELERCKAERDVARELLSLPRRTDTQAEPGARASPTSFSGKEHATPRMRSGRRSLSPGSPSPGNSRVQRDLTVHERVVGASAPSAATPGAGNSGTMSLRAMIHPSNTSPLANSNSTASAIEASPGLRGAERSPLPSAGYIVASHGPHASQSQLPYPYPRQSHHLPSPQPQASAQPPSARSHTQSSDQPSRTGENHGHSHTQPYQATPGPRFPLINPPRDYQPLGRSFSQSASGSASRSGSAASQGGARTAQNPSLPRSASLAVGESIHSHGKRRHDDSDSPGSNVAHYPEEPSGSRTYTSASAEQDLHKRRRLP